jgi:hypothetical protein
MGDLFSSPAYSLDSIIVNHTIQVMSIFNSLNYIIKFHISKLIGDNLLCKDSCGVV